MSTSLSVTAGAVLIWSLACPTVAQAEKRRGPKLPPGVEMKRDLVYGKGGERELTCDLFLPKAGPKNRPGIVFVHGGGWRGGNRRQFHRQAGYLAGKGYVGMCITYRLSGQAKFPAALEDCKCAVRWLRANAEKYDVDVNRIAACGGSAGGHLAAMVGLTDKSQGWEGTGGHAKQSSRVQLVVDFNGVSDLAALGKLAKLGSSMEKFLGPAYKDDPELYVRASPITHVRKGAPPFLLLHGNKDTTVPFAQSVEMMEKLRSVGTAAEVDETNGVGHAYFNKPPHFDKTLKRMESFLDKHFRAKTTSQR